MSRKYHYLSGVDANHYLSDTVIFTKGVSKPIYVQSIQQVGEDQTILYTELGDRLDKAEDTKKALFLAKNFEVRKFPRLGYTNLQKEGFNTEAVYITRVALRGMKQGLCNGNTQVRNAPFSRTVANFRTIYMTPTYARGLTSLFNNQFTDLQEAQEMVQLPKQLKKGVFNKVDLVEKPKGKSVAVSRVMALSTPWKDNQGNETVLLYKQDPVALGNMRDGFQFAKDYLYLRELAEEARIKIA